MIVKNESKVITRCLKSVLPLIDSWVIVDTGSTDGTQKIIKKFLKNIPGTLYERPFVDFGHNRQEALELAKGKADYILFIDADDELAFAENFKLPELTKDFYSTIGRPTAASTDTFWLPRLIKSNLNWKWEGVVHECLVCDQKTEWLPLEGVQHIYNHDGARGQDPDTWKKDIQLLLTALEKDPEHGRNCFYLAQSYLDIEDLPNALKYFEKRVQMGEKGNQEEMFLAKLQVGKIMSSLNLDPESIRQKLFSAYAYLPYRVEPLYYIARNLRLSGDNQKSYEVAKLALELCSLNITDFIRKESWIYDFGLLLEFACSSALTNHYKESMEAADRLLKMQGLPETFMQDARNCYDYSNRNNILELQTKLRAIGCVQDAS